MSDVLTSLTSAWKGASGWEGQGGTGVQWNESNMQFLHGLADTFTPQALFTPIHQYHRCKSDIQGLTFACGSGSPRRGKEEGDVHGVSSRKGCSEPHLEFLAPDAERCGTISSIDNALQLSALADRGLMPEELTFGGHPAKHNGIGRERRLWTVPRADENTQRCLRIPFISYNSAHKPLHPFGIFLCETFLFLTKDFSQNQKIPKAPLSITRTFLSKLVFVFFLPSLIDGCSSFIPTPPSIHHWTHCQAVWLQSVSFFLFPLTFYRVSPTSAMHKKPCEPLQDPPSAAEPLGNKQLEGLQFFFPKPSFPPFQLALQLLHTDLATWPDFSRALCYPHVCQWIKRELDGFCKWEWDVGSPSAASDLKLLTMNNGDTLAPRCFCTPCGTRMGPKAWTWLWDRVFWFPAFFVQHRAEARAWTGIFPCHTWWHLPLRGCFVAENSKDIKQKPRKRAMCKCHVNFNPMWATLLQTNCSTGLLAQRLRAPGARTSWRMALDSPWMWMQLSSVLFNIQVSPWPSDQQFLAPQWPGFGTTAADLGMALPLGVKNYCQPEHLQPCR